MKQITSEESKKAASARFYWNLETIFNKIEIEANFNKGVSINIERDIKPEDIEILKSLGYRVKYINWIFAKWYKISWK